MSVANVAGADVDTRHWIGGRRIASATTFTDVSPIDETPIAEMARGGEPEMAVAVRAASAAFPSWSRGQPSRPRRAAAQDRRRHRERGSRTSRSRDLRQRLVTHALTRAGDAAGRAQYPLLLRLRSQPRPSSSPRSRRRHHVQPRAAAGVTALVTPWNAPLMLATWRIGPALAAGNTVVLKPPEWAPLSGSLLGRHRQARPGSPPASSTSCKASGPRQGSRWSRTRASPDLLHRLVATGRAVAAVAAAQRHTGHAGARRQVPSAGVRRRRPRRWRPPRRGAVQQRGSGVPRRHPVLVAWSVASSSAPGSRGAPTQLTPGRPARRGLRHRPPHSPAPARTRLRLRQRALAGRRHGAARRWPSTRTGGLYYQPTLLTGVDRTAPRSCSRGGLRTRAHLQTLRHARTRRVELANGTEYGLAATIVHRRSRRAPSESRRTSSPARSGSTASSSVTSTPRSAAPDGRASAARAAPGASTSTRREEHRLRAERDGTAMGEVVGAGLLAHVPTIMLPRDARLELNEGKEISLVPGAGSAAGRDLRGPRLRHRRGARLALAHHRRVRGRRPGSARRPVHLRGTAARHVPGPLRLARRPGARPRHRRAGRPHGTWITADRRPVPADPLRDRQPVELSWAAGSTGGGSRSATPPRPATPRTSCGPGRALGDAIAATDRKVAAARLRRAVAHVLAAARTARARGQRPEPTSGPPRPEPPILERIGWFKAGDHARVHGHHAGVPDGSGRRRGSRTT